jgi:GNAT superfamily N-acetyltransferase
MDGMRGNRNHGGAALKLSYCTAVPPNMRGGIREITNIYTLESKRGQGDASRLLKEVCDEADKERMVLVIMPEPFDKGLNELELIQWYARHGFIAIQNNPTLMARQANG